MIVMPANSTGWFWHCLSRETGKLGHLYSPGQQRGPWPWFPYALDNGAFACWTPNGNTFDEEKWKAVEVMWVKLLEWTKCVTQKPMWAIVPDRPGSRDETIERYQRYAPILQQFDIPLAVAAQDGMTANDVRDLDPKPFRICVGGTTEWKWGSIEMWCREFPRQVHLLRCNAPDKLEYLRKLGVESCDGTGWNRGDRKQTAGLEKWCRGLLNKHRWNLHPYVCRGNKPEVQYQFD